MLRPPFFLFTEEENSSAEATKFFAASILTCSAINVSCASSCTKVENFFGGLHSGEEGDSLARREAFRWRDLLRGTQFDSLRFGTGRDFRHATR